MRCDPLTDIDEPDRVTARIDNADPMLINWLSESADPMRAKPRKDSDDPMHIQLSTLTVLPPCTVLLTLPPITDTQEPQRIRFLMEAEDPKLRTSYALNLVPMRVKLRTERLEFSVAALMVLSLSILPKATRPRAEQEDPTRMKFRIDTDEPIAPKQATEKAELQRVKHRRLRLELSLVA
jgi:hypothetical protein